MLLLLIFVQELAGQLDVQAASVASKNVVHKDYS